MREPIGEGRIEDDLKPILRIETAVDERVAGGCLHPAVRRQDPERGKQRAEGYHHGSDEVRPGRHQLAAEQQDAKEGRLEKECEQALISQQWTDHVRGGVRKTAPVGPELKRQDDPRHHAHAERDSEDPDPEIRDPEIDRASGRQMQPLEHCDIGGSTQRERRQQDMPRDDPGELNARQNEGICTHRLPPISEILGSHDTIGRQWPVSHS